MISNSLLSNSVRLNNFTQIRNLKRPAINVSQQTEKRRVGALAMKVGMMGIVDKWGTRHAATVLQLDNCQVTQVKELDVHGYTSLQLGVGEAKEKNVNKPLAGHFDKIKEINPDFLPNRKLKEFRITPDMALPLGTIIHAKHFVPGQYIDIQGTTKGKGFQGAMKRWNFGGGRATHGNSLSHRILGSTGGRQDPGKVFKNKKMAGRMGGDTVTVQNLKILKIDPKRELIYVLGAVPGNAGTFCKISDATKGPFFPTPPPYPTYFPSVNEDLEEIWMPMGDVDVGLKKTPEEVW